MADKLLQIKDIEKMTPSQIQEALKKLEAESVFVKVENVAKGERGKTTTVAAGDSNTK